MITHNDFYNDEQYKKMDLFDLFDLINSDKISGETFKQLVGSTMRDKVRNLYMRLHPVPTSNNIQLQNRMGVIGITVDEQAMIIAACKLRKIKCDESMEKAEKYYSASYFNGSITRWWESNTHISNPVTFSEFIQAILNEPEKPKEVKVKLNDSHSAVVSKDSIKVGCQTFSLSIIDSLAAAKKEVEQ